MAQTLVTREMFDGIGTLTNGSIGNLGTWVAGSFYKRGVGPSTVSSSLVDGFSSDMRGESADTYWDSTNQSAAFPIGAVHMWIRFSAFPTGDFSHSANFLKITTAADGFMLQLGVDSLGDFGVFDSGANSIVGTFQLHTWYYIVVEFRVVSGITAAYKVLWMPLGEALTVVKDRSTPYSTGGAQFARVHIGNFANNGGFWSGRIGGVSLYSLSVLGDTVYPADLITPISQRRTWYVNPSTGNDNNSGLSTTTAWQTASKLNSELTNGGVFGTLTPWKSNSGIMLNSMTGKQFKLQNDYGGLVSNGDTVVIDTSLSPLVIDTQVSVGSLCPGVHLTSATSSMADCRAVKVISSSSWSRTAGTTNVYQSSDTEQYVVLWEDRKWLNHPIGANLAAVQSTLDSTPGSFWTDGTTMYLHPFNNTDPRTDGKVYERSYLLSDQSKHAVTVVGGDIHVSNLSIFGTAIVDPAANDIPGNTNHYCLQAVANNNKINNCFLSYGAKHTQGTLGGTDTKAVIWEDIQCEQGPAWLTSGAQTLFVVFDTINGTKLVSFRRCKTIHNKGLIGSTSGQDDILCPVFYTHSAGSGKQWSDIFIEDCDFSNALLGQSDNGVRNGIQVTRTRLGACGFDSAFLDRCYIDFSGMLANSNGTLIARSCIIVPTRRPGNDLGDRISGKMDIQYCTYDFTNNAGTGTIAMLYRTGTSNLTFRNNVLITIQGQNLALISDAVNTDLLNIDNNIYVLGASSLVSLNYNDGSLTSNRTLVQWQTLGFDISSQNTSPLLNSSYTPTITSPGINSGLNIGSLSSYLTKWVRVRNDVGAIELPVMKSQISRNKISRRPIVRSKNKRYSF